MPPPSLYLLLAAILFLPPFHTKAMEEFVDDRKPSPDTFHIVIGPEQQQLMQRRQIIALAYPQLACPIPCIKSQEEFNLATEYLTLSIHGAALLHYAFTVSSNQSKAANLLILSEKTLQEMWHYQKTLEEEGYHAFKTQKDSEELRKAYYDIRYRMAENQLFMLTIKSVTPGYSTNRSYFTPHLQEIKRLEDLLQESPEHRKKLKTAISEFKAHPMLNSLFQPQGSTLAPRPPKKTSRKIEAYREAKKNEKMLQSITESFPSILQKEGVENFDMFFELTTRSIMTQYVEISTKNLPPEEYRQKLKILTANYIDLEKKGCQFKSLVSHSTLPSQTEALTGASLTELYKFLCQRYDLPHKNPLGLLEQSILIFIQANEIEAALMRTEALGCLLPEAIAQSENFQILRASVLALNGQIDEWKRILSHRKNHIQSEKHLQRQKIVANIKSQQAETKREREAKIKEKTGEKKEKLSPKTELSIQDNSQNFTNDKFPEKTERYTVPIPREKIKTRKPPSLSPLEKPCGPESALVPVLPLKDYPVSKNAFSTFRKIREGNWHFPRKDLYNLFDKLGCRIDIEQGKGDHGTIHLPLMMTIHNAEEIVVVLPEFRKKETSEEFMRPLTIPNWDEKWDGRVPPYMRKGILGALDYLGATEATVHK